MMNRIGKDVPWYEITDEYLYRNRRHFLKTVSMGVAAAMLPGCSSNPPAADQTAPNQPPPAPPQQAEQPAPQEAKQPGADAAPKQAEPIEPEKPVEANKANYDTNEPPTPYEAITTYNNYYEFGIEKDEPARNSGNFRTKPWTVSVEGLVKKPAVYALEDLLKGLTVYDRIYRMRCVEGWSMIIPWQGVQLSDILKKLEPAPSAKYVRMETYFDVEQMPGTRRMVLDWPYVEGLRLDEAMNPLTLIATGIYGKSLLNQNGAPLRLVTPWKYGFKGVKAIVKIQFVDVQPQNSWAIASPDEYGFYANVNPEVNHPRWSQATERPIGQKVTVAQIARGEVPRKPTLMFNGYGEHVAAMYSGMDLRKFY